MILAIHQLGRSSLSNIENHWYSQLHPPLYRASEVALVVKNPAANAGDERDAGSNPGLGRSPGEGNGNLLQYSCLENLVDRGAWQAMGLQRVGQDWSEWAHMHIHCCCFRCSVAKLCSTLCDHMDCSMPGLPVLHYLLEFAQIYVHWIDVI